MAVDPCIGAARCPSTSRARRLEALAIHHEHRLRDIEAAKAFALHSLGIEAAGAANRRSSIGSPG